MSKQTQAISDDVNALAQDARDLVAATANVAGDEIKEARKRLAAALESGREMAGRVRDRAVAGAKVADRTVRENPYQSIGLALGVGTILGYLLARRCSRRHD